MTNSSKFLIENDSEVPLSLSVEPEGVMFVLQPQKNVVVKDDYDTLPVTVRASHDENGALVLCIWPGDGETCVEQDGKDVLTA